MADRTSGRTTSEYALTLYALALVAVVALMLFVLMLVWGPSWELGVGLPCASLSGAALVLGYQHNRARVKVAAVDERRSALVPDAHRVVK